jgi:tungstate transport system ATP-binding protein
MSGKIRKVMSNIYELTNISMSYGKRKVLDIPFLEIKKGVCYALLGPNGAGKTTLLNILGFIHQPLSGQILFDAKQIPSKISELTYLRKKVTIIDQSPIFFTDTVYKNLEFGLKIRKIPLKKRKILIENALELVGMQNFINYSAKKLSGGETKRIAIARAFVLNPEVLLCDEPFANIDAQNQDAVLNILKRINKKDNISIIFTTHDRRMAASLADKTLFLNHGKISKEFENIFYAKIKDYNEEFVFCSVQDMLYIKAYKKTAVQKNETAQIIIDSKKIIFTSNLDSYKGKIILISEEDDTFVRIVVDIGIRINILITALEYKEKKIMIGDIVYINIPIEAVKVVI